MTHDGAASEHYQRLAATYDANWNYSPGYVERFAAAVVSAIALTSGDRIADVGCGTGLYTEAIRARIYPDAPILCIDPSSEMLAQVPDDASLVAIQASAEDVAAGRVDAVPASSLDAILVKEAIHHVAAQSETIDGLARRLSAGGRILIAMLPSTIDLPLFEAALRRFEEFQPDPYEICTAMRSAGLVAHVETPEFLITIPKARYLDMVRNRYMSLLSTFTDEEIQVGVDEIDATNPGDILEFSDRFAFVVGRRPVGS